MSTEDQTPQLTSNDLTIMLDDLSLQPDTRAAVETLLAVTLASEPNTGHRTGFDAVDHSSRKDAPEATQSAGRGTPRPHPVRNLLSEPGKLVTEHGHSQI